MAAGAFSTAGRVIGAAGAVCSVGDFATGSVDAFCAEPAATICAGAGGAGDCAVAGAFGVAENQMLTTQPSARPAASAAAPAQYFCRLRGGR